MQASDVKWAWSDDAPLEVRKVKRNQNPNPPPFNYALFKFKMQMLNQRYTHNGTPRTS